MINTLKKKLEDMDIDIDFTDKAIETIANRGFDDIYGARPLRRAIQSDIEDAISEKILEKDIIPKQKYICDYNDDKFTFEKV